MNPLPIEVHANRLPPLGMSPRHFLAHYWQRRPLLIRQAFADFVSPISPDELAGLACEPSALSRMVTRQRKRAGNDPRHSHWLLRQGPFEEADFSDLPERDWSLLVQDVDKWDADVAALLDAFAFLPRWRIDDIMVSFAAPGGGVGPHTDQYDVFLLQAQGHRHWQVGAQAEPEAALRKDSELKLLSTFTPAHDWVLAPGDMLYLPPGFAHHGDAVDACLTISVGMRAPAEGELLADLADTLAQALPDHLRYRDPDLTAPKDPFEIDAAAITRLRAALGPLGTLDDAALRLWFGRFITSYRSATLPDANAKPRRIETIAQALAGGRALARHPFARVAWTRIGRGARLFVAGEAYPMSARSAALIAAITPLDASAFAQCDGAAHQALALLLARGSYALQRQRGRNPC